MEWHKIELSKDRDISSMKAGGKNLCVISQEGKVHVTAARCPHAGADLSQGWCEEGKLVCPFHRHRFDIASGRGDPGQGNYIRTYPVKKDNEQWYVGIPKPWWKIF